jgi:hypothetical protein
MGEEPPKMMLLVPKPISSLLAHWDSAHLGTLTSPRVGIDLEPNHLTGTPWAADNDAFSDTWDESRWYDFVERLTPFNHCLWVAVPDVVGNATETLIRFYDHYLAVARAGKPVALVAQDGLIPDDVPWIEIDCLFIGGSTEWKESSAAWELGREAKRQGKLLHVGRVNSLRRLRYAHQMGADTVDGTKWARWTDTHLPRGLAELRRLDRQLNQAEG